MNFKMFLYLTLRPWNQKCSVVIYFKLKHSRTLEYCLHLFFLQSWWNNPQPTF